ncbi:hypothetical protein AMEX_G13063, partial [Astyanax mexicanus]
HSMFYNRPAPLKVKCAAMRLMTRAESFEMVDSVVVIKNKKLVANCALTDGQEIIVAHLKNEECGRMEEGGSYIIKNPNVTDKYGHKSLFFNSSTIVFKTADLAISAEIKEKCHHTVHPASGPLGSSGDFFSLTGVIISVSILNSTRMLATRDGPVPVRELILEDEGKHHEVTLWREAALEELALSQLTEITHLKIVSTKRQERKFNSTVHTTLKVNYY